MAFVMRRIYYTQFVGHFKYAGVVGLIVLTTHIKSAFHHEF